MFEAVIWIILLVASGFIAALALASRRNADKFKHRG